MEGFEFSITSWISVVGIGIEVFGVLVILIGIAWATLRYLQTGENRASFASRFRLYRIRLGQSLLLGLEILVAADIVRTVALEPNFANLGALGLLVVIRTFLSWALVVEIEGRWPWQSERRPEASGSKVNGSEVSGSELSGSEVNAGDGDIL